jgi:polysaccharide export outer membrane protein
MLQEGGFVKNPQVVLAITEIRSQQVAVLGFVKNSAKIPFEGSMSIIDVIAQAGGFTTEAGDTVQILREEGTKRKVIRVDMGSVFNGAVDQVIDVRAGDVVLVPRMDMFYIYGEVRKPGSYRLERDMTVVQALSIGGGLSERGTQKGIRVRRRNTHGSVEELDVDLNGILKPNDVIFVKESLL